VLDSRLALAVLLRRCPRTRVDPGAGGVLRDNVDEAGSVQQDPETVSTTPPAAVGDPAAQAHARPSPAAALDATRMLPNRSILLSRRGAAHLVRSLSLSESASPSLLELVVGGRGIGFCSENFLEK